MHKKVRHLMLSGHSIIKYLLDYSKEIRFSPCWLIQQCGYMHGGRPADLEIILQIIERNAGIQDVLDQDEMPVGNILIEILVDFHGPRRRCSAVRGNRHKVHGTRYVHIPHQVRHKDETAFQHADEDRILILKIPGDLFSDLCDLCLDFFL